MFDVIVIGAGHNGLIAAALLAENGAKVLVLERRSILGGACVTEELESAPGFSVSTGAAQIANLPHRLVGSLALEDFGFRLLLPDPLSVFTFPDGRCLPLWQDPKRTKLEVARFSRTDARALADYVTECNLVCGILEPLVETDDVCSLDDIEASFHRAGQPELFTEFILGSIEAVLSKRFESPELKAVLGYAATFGTNAGPSERGTAYVMVHHMLGGTSGIRGRAGYVEGGMGGLARALTDCASARGVALRADAQVDRIVIENGCARGVELRGGERIHARAVISNADPHATFLRLVGAEHLPAGLTAAVSSLQLNGVAMKVNCALSELPVFESVPREIVPARVSICPSLDYVSDAWAHAREGFPSPQPIMTVHMQSAIDPSLAPEGRHTLSCYAHYFPYHLDPKLGGWDRQRARAGAIILETLARYAPDIRGKIIATDIVTPLDIERTFAMTGGHQFHGDLMPGQLFDQRPGPGCAGARTPLDGLYLCSAGTHPGGCIWGAPGERAARAVLADAS